SPIAPSTATRSRGTPPYGKPCSRRNAGLGARAGARAPTTSAVGDSSPELSPEGGVFSNDFLIPPALDGGLRHRGHLTDGFRVLQVSIDRCDHDACLNGDEVDPDQRDTHPGIDDDPLIQYSVEDVD